MAEPFGNAPSRLAAAKTSAARMIRGLPGDVRVGLVEFSACGRVRRDRYYDAPEREILIGNINGMTPQEGTPLAESIRRAGVVAAREAPVALVIVTDGDDSCGGDPCAEARRAKAQRPELVINVVDLSSNPRDRAVLQCVASAGGGRLLSPGDPLDLQRKIDEAAAPAACKP